MKNQKSLLHLYIHVPFCARTCPYCAFYVHQGGVAFQREFGRALKREILQAKDQYAWDLETIYFGGGTPSLLSPELFGEIVSVLPRGIREVTLEVNPATVTPAKMEAWKEGGVNRVSLGAQTFDSGYLRLLGRDHEPHDIANTVASLREYGFENINIDLMFALPDQPREVWIATLNQALACRPEHISCYALTYEEDTPFYESLRLGQYRRLEEDEIWMFHETERLLVEAGLPGYEISNFSRPGYESLHNRAYWLGKDYLGIGPSAFSTIGGKRWYNVKDTRLYIETLQAEGSARREIEEITLEIRNKERIMFGLRMKEGVNKELFDGFESQLSNLVELELLSEKLGNFALTPRGRLVADRVAEFFA